MKGIKENQYKNSCSWNVVMVSWQGKYHKSPGLDGFSNEFYQTTEFILQMYLHLCFSDILSFLWLHRSHHQCAGHGTTFRSCFSPFKSGFQVCKLSRKKIHTALEKITIIKLDLHQRYALIIIICHTWNNIIEYLCISKGKNYMNVSIYSNRTILLCTWKGLFRFYHTAVGHFV